MNNISRLAEIFADFPGIGPRQAKRFVYFLLSKDPSYANEFVKLIQKVKEGVRTCDSCFRFFNTEGYTGGLTPTQGNDNAQKTCDICRDSNRDRSLLVIVSRDADLENIEKTHSHRGLYFVLGGVVPILEKNPHEKIRLNELEKIVVARSELKEIILAMSSNTEGEHTSDFLKNFLSPIAEKTDIKITMLGRGLSTGTELEYSDADTLKNALNNRQ
ncbi:MAG: toprim domain-containing protein [Patescibacteria group bacterium]